MGLETMNFISDFNTAWPLGSDQEKQGDDHLRGIKTALKATFLDTFTTGIYLPKITSSAADALILATLKNLSAGINVVNGQFVGTVAANALTIALKTKAGSDPSATDPVYFIFRNATAATGDYTVVTVTAAMSLVVSSGSTLGTVNSTAFRLWIVAFNDAGTVRLGVINTRSGVNIAAIRDDLLASSTAEGGAGGADSAQVFYTGTAVASKAYRLVAYMDWGSGLATAGTWSSGPTKIQLFGPGVAKPGDVVQMVRTDTGAVATGTTLLPHDDTIPQITEGIEFMTQAITPVSAADLLAVQAQVCLANSAGPQELSVALFQDATSNALKAAVQFENASNQPNQLQILHLMLAATASSTTFRIRGGGNGAGTTTFNGSAAARIFGGVHNSYMDVREIMS